MGDPTHARTTRHAAHPDEATRTCPSFCGAPFLMTSYLRLLRILAGLPTSGQGRRTRRRSYAGGRRKKRRISAPARDPTDVVYRQCLGISSVSPLWRPPPLSFRPRIRRPPPLAPCRHPPAPRTRACSPRRKTPPEARRAASISRGNTLRRDVACCVGSLPEALTFSVSVSFLHRLPSHINSA